MPLTPASSNILFWYYSKDRQTLTVFYKSTPYNYYVFKNVPQEIEERLKVVQHTGESVGSWLNSFVTRAYPFDRVASEWLADLLQSVREDPKCVLFPTPLKKK